MSIELMNVAIPKTSRTASSKYKFGDLTVGGPAMVESEVVDSKKAQSKMTSALVAYRSRTGDRSRFSVRTFKAEDGTDRIGVWKIAEAPAA
jgi:hypothetical protein